MKCQMPKMLLSAFLLLAQLSASNAATITYDIDFDFDTAHLSGQITTNGTIGLVGADEIVSWDFSVQASNGNWSFSSANSYVYAGVSDEYWFTATSDELSFGFGGSFGFLIFNRNNFSSSLCFQAAAANCQIELEPGIILGDPAVGIHDPYTGAWIYESFYEPAVIGTVAAVPLPSSVYLLLLSAAALFGAGLRARKSTGSMKLALA